MATLMGRTIAQRLDWMESFATGVSASAASYFISAADATAIDAAVGAAREAQRVAVNPDTRTKATLVARDEALAAAEVVCRRFAVTIRFNPQISDQLKAAVGVPPAKTPRRPKPPLTTAPSLDVESIIGGRFITTRVHGENGRKKEPGAVGASVFIAFGAEPPEEGKGYEFAGLATRNKLEIEVPAAATARTMWIVASWYSARGENSPACAPVRVDLPVSPQSPVNPALKLAA